MPIDPVPSDSESLEFHEFVNEAPSGSKVEVVLSALRKQRMIRVNTWLKTNPGNWHVDLLLVADIICNPTDPRNNWKYMAETLNIYGEPYLRLVDRIPLDVQKRWMKDLKTPDVRVQWHFSRPTPPPPPQANKPSSAGRPKPPTVQSPMPPINNDDFDSSLA